MSVLQPCSSFHGTGAVQDVLQEHYNDALRDMRDATMAHEESMAASSGSEGSEGPEAGATQSEQFGSQRQQHEGGGWASSSGRAEGGSGSWWQGQGARSGAAEAGPRGGEQEVRRLAESVVH